MRLPAKDAFAKKAIYPLLTKMTKRIDFNETTKREAAEKVAYFCSNPDCKRLTIATNDSGEPHRYGEAAHIYAAASGGPRSNKNLSEKELKSESNCIWLCNTCHEIIDSNPNRYSPELLKEWKKSAETRAFELVTNPEKARQLINEIERASGLTAYFDELFLRGDFQKIVLSIRELSKRGNLSEPDKEELLFAQIRFDSFCARKNLPESLLRVSSASQSLKERVVDFAIKCFDAELCGNVLVLSNSQIKRELAKKISSSDDYEMIMHYVSENFEAVKSFGVLDYIHVVGGLFSEKVVLDQQGKRISCRKGWLLNIADTISDFINDGRRKKPIQESRLQPITDQRALFLWLDPHYIDLLLGRNLKWFPKGKVLESFLADLIRNGVSTEEIRLDYFFSVLPEEKRKEAMPEALKLGLLYGDDRLLPFALSLISEEEPDKVVSFVEEHFSLAKQNLLIINAYSEAKKKLGEAFDLLDFLENQYEGEKNSRYYLHYAFAQKIANNEREFRNSWETYKTVADCSDVCVTLALKIASEIEDTRFIESVCEKSTNVPALLCAAEIICKSRSFGLGPTRMAISRLEEFLGATPKGYYELLFALAMKAQMFEKALDYGNKAYFLEGEKRVAPYVLQLKLRLSKIEEDDLVRDVYSSSSDYKALALLGDLYTQAGKQRLGWTCLARAAALQNSIKSGSVVVKFAECDLGAEKEESDDYTYVVLDDGASFLLLPNVEKRYFRTRLFGTDVYFTDDNKTLLFLQIGDSVEINGKKHVVQGVFDYFYFFNKNAMRGLILDPSAKTFRSSDPKEVLEQLCTVVSQAADRQEKLLASTNGLPVPFFLFARQFGKGVFEAAEALYYSDKRKSFFVLDENGEHLLSLQLNKPLFDVESFYLAFKLGISPNTIKDAHCCIGSLTKGALANELAQKRNEYHSKTEKGYLTINKSVDKPVYVPRTKENRQKALQTLEEMERLLDSFEVVNLKLSSYTEEQNALLSALIERGDNIDAEVFEALWAGKTVITNNNGLFIAQSLGSGKACDFSAFLAKCSCPLSETIEAIRRFQKTNVYQYLTPSVSASLASKLELMDEGQEKEKLIDEIVGLIDGNWDGSWTVEEKKKHRALVTLAFIGEKTKLSKINRINASLQRVFQDFLSDDENQDLS